MNQYIPSADRTDVERIIARDFSSDQYTEVLKTLALYGPESHHQEVDRVHLDILKLADGNHDRLSQETENACCDYRDTILAAEYPNYGKKWLKMEKLSSDERKHLIESDRDQYLDWLNRI